MKNIKEMLLKYSGSIKENEFLFWGYVIMTLVIFTVNALMGSIVSGLFFALIVSVYVVWLLLEEVADLEARHKRYMDGDLFNQE